MTTNTSTSGNKSSKAALYSAFIFPGAGLWWLKFYGRACVFIIPSFLLLAYIAAKLYDGVAPVYKKLQREAAEGLIDVTDIFSIYSKLNTEIHNSLAAQQGQLVTMEILLVACWLCSIASSYFAGKKMDLETNNYSK